MIVNNKEKIIHNHRSIKTEVLKPITVSFNIRKIKLLNFWIHFYHKKGANFNKLKTKTKPIWKNNPSMGHVNRQRIILILNILIILIIIKS